MVDLPTLASDVLQNVLFFAVPPVLWLFLFLLAWEHPSLARATGFGRLTFWLLLPGGLVGTIPQLPIFPVGAAVVAVSVGGGIIPLFLSALLLRRVFAGSTGATRRFTVLFLLEGLLALLGVLFLPARIFPVPLFGTGSLAGVWVVAVAVSVPLAAWTIPPHSLGARRAALALGLSSLALALTFLTTTAVPLVGIVSSFPWYLLAPLLIGLFAVLLAQPVARLSPWEGITLGYPAATVGVVVGADVLNQPPLYGPGAAGIYSIGGAGLLDLVYLSGLLALAAGFLGYWVLQRYFGAPRPVPDHQTDAPVTAFGRLRTAVLLLFAGRSGDSVAESAAAAREARTVARALSGLPATSFTGQGWGDVGAPPWVDVDQTNLDALEAKTGLGVRDAWRAHLTARHLVRIGRDLGRRRLGTLTRRSAAFLLDLTLVTLPAVVVWVFLSTYLPGSASDVLGGADFNAAAYGYASYAFLYFVLGEAVWGTTLGKRLLHLRVRDRALRPAGPLSIVVRDLPKLIPLTILGVGGAAATYLAVHGGTVGRVTAGGAVLLSSSTLLALYLLGAVVVGVTLCGLASAVVMTSSSENQRLGDYIAGTWVIQE